MYLAQPGAFYGEYFNNAFLDGVPVKTSFDTVIEFDWSTGLITDEAADFISIRWTGLIQAPITEQFTFIVQADDGVRFYLNGVLLVDRWDTCCNDMTASIDLIANEYYKFQLEFKEHQEEAYIKIYWTSLSIPKQLIPSSQIYYLERVGSSEYPITVNFGPSIASMSDAYGDGLSTATAGKLAYLFIQSRDINGDIIDNTDDSYQLTFTGPDGSNLGDFFTSSSYMANGLYQAQYVP